MQFEHVWICKWRSVIPCGSLFPLVLITAHWHEDPAVLIKSEGRKDWDDGGLDAKKRKATEE